MSAELSERVTRAAAQVAVSWSAERAAEVLRGVHRRKRRLRRLRGLGAVATVLILAGLSPRLISWLHAPRAMISSLTSGPKNMPRPGELRSGELGPGELVSREPPPLQLRDGSVARPQGQRSRVRVREDRPQRTVVELAGAAQFDVVHDPQRLFRVETPGLAVEVLGTRFLVSEQGSQVRVTVQQGRVRVLWASHYEELGAGQSALFLPEQPVATAAAPPPLSEPGPELATPRGEPAPPSGSKELAPPSGSKELARRLSTRRVVAPSEQLAPPPAAAPPVAAGAIDAAPRPPS